MKRIALCFSGHIREFQYDNIKEKFIDILLEYGCEVDYYFSIWNTEGHRQKSFSGTLDISKILEETNPKGILIEEFDREYFLRRYQTDKWKEYNHLSNYTTCPDSVSMWYKIQKCLDMVENYQTRYNFTYDVIVRIRPDVLFSQTFEKEVLDKIFTEDVLYIPKWHGKWREVSLTITDYFGIGNYKVMKQYMSVFNNINNLLNRKDIPHTGEGLLAGQIEDIKTMRLKNGFSVKRVGYIEMVVE